MKAVHFACDLTSLLRHRNPEKKKDVYKNSVCYLATNVAIYYVINEIYKKRSELLKVRNCSYCDPGLPMFHGKKWGK